MQQVPITVSDFAVLVSIFGAILTGVIGLVLFIVRQNARANERIDEQTTATNKRLDDGLRDAHARIDRVEERMVTVDQHKSLESQIASLRQLIQEMGNNLSTRLDLFITTNHRGEK